MHVAIEVPDEEDVRTMACSPDHVEGNYFGSI